MMVRIALLASLICLVPGLTESQSLVMPLTADWEMTSSSPPVLLTGVLYQSSSGVVRSEPDGYTASIIDWETKELIALNHDGQMALILTGRLSPKLTRSMPIEVQDEWKLVDKRVLGGRVILGFEADGVLLKYREPDGTEIRVEAWFSKRLDLHLLRVVERVDPDGGVESDRFHVSNIVLGQPDPELFEIPEDYEIREVPPSPRTE